MIDMPYWLSILLTFSVFCGVCWRLWKTAQPSRSLACRAQWFAWGAVHIGVAVGMLGILMRDIGRDDHLTPWYVLVLRLSLALLFLMSWRRRGGES